MALLLWLLGRSPDWVVDNTQACDLQKDSIRYRDFDENDVMSAFDNIVQITFTQCDPLGMLTHAAPFGQIRSIDSEKRQIMDGCMPVPYLKHPNPQSECS